MIHPGQTWAPWAWAGEFRGLIDSYNSLLPHFNPFFYAPRPIHLFCRRRAADWESRNCWHQTIVVHFDTAAFVLSHRSSWLASAHGISMLTYMVIISKEVSSNYFFASETEPPKETTFWKVGGASLTSSTSICQIDVKPLLFLRFKSNLIFNVLEISPPGCFAFQSLLLIELIIRVTNWWGSQGSCFKFAAGNMLLMNLIFLKMAS